MRVALPMQQSFRGLVTKDKHTEVENTTFQIYGVRGGGENKLTITSVATIFTLNGILMRRLVAPHFVRRRGLLFRISLIFRRYAHQRLKHSPGRVEQCSQVQQR